ncbi:LysE family translocator [Zavarzinia sp.]|uniref:LysE family translocator n=1 Tax=Zavarzinia sp. TaxID=2027920 RepID=UPI003BB815CC
MPDLSLSLFASAFALGFFIAMPVGPISLLILRRTVAGGIGIGVATGLGAATADTIYAALAAFGLSAVTALLIDEASLLGIIGGLVLIWLGIGGFRAAGRRGGLMPEAAGGAEMAKVGAVAPAFFTAVALTLTNPLTVISFAGAFAGIGLAASAGGGAALSTVIGLGLGSATWQLLIVAAAGGARHLLSPRILAAIDRLSGIVLVVFGVLALWRGLQ